MAVKIEAIYVYLPDTLADWELGHAVAELHSGRFFKKDARRIPLKTVANAKAPIRTMGGLTVVPDGLVDEIEARETSMLLLPGGNTWSDPNHAPVLKKRANCSPWAARCAPFAEPP